MARNVSTSICLLDARKLWYALMRTSWIDQNDNSVQLLLSGILFWMIATGSKEEARAVAMAWDNGVMKYPRAQGMKVI